MKIDYKKILKKFGENYDFIYDTEIGGGEVAGYGDALNYFDDMMDNNPPFADFVRKLANFRGDFFASDREIVALVFALDDLRLLDAVESGKIEEKKSEKKVPCDMKVNGKDVEEGTSYEIRYDRVEGDEYVLGVDIENIGTTQLRFSSKAEAKKEGWILESKKKAIKEKEVLVDVVTSSYNFNLLDRQENEILVARKIKTPLSIEKDTIICNDYNVHLEFKFTSYEVINDITVYFYNRDGYILTVYAY